MPFLGPEPFLFLPFARNSIETNRQKILNFLRQLRPEKPPMRQSVNPTDSKEPFL